MVSIPTTGPAGRKKLAIQDAADLESGQVIHYMGLARLAGVLALAMMVLAVFESEGLLNWALRLPAGPVGDLVVEAAGQWHDLMTRLGAPRLHLALRTAFLYLKSAGF